MVRIRDRGNHHFKSAVHRNREILCTVAIPATILYNALTGRVNTLIVRMENQVNEMTLMLEEGEAEK